MRGNESRRYGRFYRALVARNAHPRLRVSVLRFCLEIRVTGCAVRVVAHEKPEYERHRAIDTLCAAVKFNASLVMSITVFPCEIAIPCDPVYLILLSFLSLFFSFSLSKRSPPRAEHLH